MNNQLENEPMSTKSYSGTYMISVGLISAISILVLIWFTISDHGPLLLGSNFTTATSIKNYEPSVQTFRQRKCPSSHPTRSNVTCKQPIIDFRPYLVVPIYRNHFSEASRFFQTFVKNVVDLDRIDIQIVLSDEKEVLDFIAHLQRNNIPFEKMNLHFWSFHRLIRSLGINLYEGWDKFSSKLPYLSLKKLAGLSVSKKWQYALIIDCEAIIRKSTNFTEVFLDFFISPYMFYENASIHKWLTDGSRQALRIPDSALPSKDTFVGQYHGWFLERSIFDKLLTHLLYNSTDLLHWAHSVPEFSNEYIYHLWLLWNRNGIASHYTFIDIAELLKTFLPTELMKRSYPAWDTRILPQGSFECLYCWATPEIIDLLNPFFVAYKLTFYDYHTDHTNEVGDCTIIRLMNTVSTTRIQATSQANIKGSWDQLNCDKVYHGKTT
jgi:hypothetical protein